MIPLQKLPKNVEDLGKLIVAKGLKKLPKVQKIAQSGHTACQQECVPFVNKNSNILLQNNQIFVKWGSDLAGQYTPHN